MVVRTAKWGWLLLQAVYSLRLLTSMLCSHASLKKLCFLETRGRVYTPWWGSNVPTKVCPSSLEEFWTARCLSCKLLRHHRNYKMAHSSIGWGWRLLVSNKHWCDYVLQTWKSLAKGRYPSLQINPNLNILIILVGSCTSSEPGHFCPKGSVERMDSCRVQKGGSSSGICAFCN
jgi:hypothetical protein